MDTEESSGGMGLLQWCILLTLIFSVMKLSGISVGGVSAAEVSWWVVSLPLWGGILSLWALIGVREGVEHFQWWREYRWRR